MKTRPFSSNNSLVLFQAMYLYLAIIQLNKRQMTVGM